MTVHIRPVTFDDVDAILALWKNVFPEYDDTSRPQRAPRASIERKLKFGDGLFWLAERDGAIVGTVMAGYDGHRGWVYSMGVHTAHRRHGIASALLRHAETELAARDCIKINMQVLSGNADALAFYARHGYSGDAVTSIGKRLA